MNPSRDDRAAVVALLRRSGIGAPGAAERIEREGARAALAEALGAGSSLLPEDPRPLVAAAAVEIDRWAARGLRLVTVLDADYPENLRLVHDRPAMLLASGDPGLLHTHNAISVVGSRHPSPAGRAHAVTIATELAAAGQTVVSGLAAGIDTAAHRASLAAGGRTIAVIGSGHDHAFPRQNAELQAQLAHTQLVLSPFWPETPPHPDGFRFRNGVMSGLTLGTVIVEASVRSGTRVQARLALGHGRPVFLARPLLAQAWAAELAARPGVHVVETAADVLAVTTRLDDSASPTDPS